MAQLIIPDASGDTRMEFTADDSAAVASCMAVFDSMRAKGHQWADTSNPSDKKLIRSFDPSAETIIMIPQLIGG